MEYQQKPNSQLWNAGPALLPNTVQWPTWEYNHRTAQIPSEEPGDTLISTTTVSSLQCIEIPGIHRVVSAAKYSTYLKLLRVTAYSCRFIYNSRRPRANRETGSEKKCYICLFACTATRAVHLEVVSDLSTPSFLQAFWRFTSRKSLPKVMISDNATRYIAAASHLKKLLSSPAVQEELSKCGTECRFIPARAP